jgi:hypothetical protein
MPMIGPILTSLRGTKITGLTSYTLVKDSLLAQEGEASTWICSASSYEIFLLTITIYHLANHTLVKLMMLKNIHNRRWEQLGALYDVKVKRAPRSHDQPQEMFLQVWSIYFEKTCTWRQPRTHKLRGSKLE